MAKSPVFAAQMLAWVFHGAAPPWASAETLWISLHSDAPGGAGSAQSDSETGYAGYHRQPVARALAAVLIDPARGEATNLAGIEFPVCTQDGGGTVTHYGIGTDATGAGTLIYSGLLDEPMTVQRRHAPRLPARAMSVKEI